MPWSMTLVQIFGILIPVVAIIGGFSFAMLVVYVRFRRKREALQLLHAERMAAIEKGMDLPPLPPEVLESGLLGGTSRWRARRSSGLMTLFVGLALTFVLRREGGDWWGLIVVAVGLAQLLSAYLESRQPPREPPGSMQPGRDGIGPDARG